jgi:hypothetical protein
MPIFWLFENAYLSAWEVLKKNPIFCLSPIRRTSGRKSFLFSDALAIAEAYVGFCVGLTYPPSPIRRILLYLYTYILHFENCFEFFELLIEGNIAWKFFQKWLPEENIGFQERSFQARARFMRDYERFQH